MNPIRKFVLSEGRALRVPRFRSALEQIRDSRSSSLRDRIGTTWAAFTLLELLVVLAVIGTLAALTLPALKGLGQSNLISAATHQVSADLALARSLAISKRTTVSMVFVPTNLFEWLNFPPPPPDRAAITNLISAQYSGYALVASRTVGDQPGAPRPQYLTDWKKLPEGMLFVPSKLSREARFRLATNEYVRSLPMVSGPIPFPDDLGLPLGPRALPGISFNAEGQLVLQRDEVIAIARGSIFIAQDSAGNFVPEEPEVQLTTTNYNFVRVDWLTGRAKVEVPVLR